MLTEHACPIGTQCYALSRLPDHADLHQHSKTLLMDWSESRFAQLDKKNARVLALLANTMEEPHIVTSLLEHTRSWVASL